jgi:hypothetical protein
MWGAPYEDERGSPVRPSKNGMTLGSLAAKAQNIEAQDLVLNAPR